VIGSILVPLDGSHIAESALPYAAWIAHGAGCPLVLITVVNGSGEQADESAEQPGDALEAAAAPLKAPGLDLRTELRQGSPAEVIAERASEADIGLVVLTTFGRGADPRHLGSVTDRLVRTLKRPALFVNPASDAQAPPPGPFIVALDGSQTAEAAIASAVDLAAALGRPLVLARVAPWAGELYAAITAPTPPSADGDIELGSNTYLAEQVERLPKTVDANYQTLRGHPEPMLVEYAQNQNGILVLATHGQSANHLWHLGSTTDKVLRASESPVLIVPAAHRRA
jgi:nucleotide-binding universal stress UspA family protein